MADEERMDALENQLKEARFLAEEADKKYDEVHINTTINLCQMPNLKDLSSFANIAVQSVMDATKNSHKSSSTDCNEKPVKDTTKTNAISANKSCTTIVSQI